MRYIVPGIPAGQDRSAFTPGMTRMAASGAQSYKGRVSGQPGTQGIPAPTRDTNPAPGAQNRALMGRARSSDAPDTWYPNKYYLGALPNTPQTDGQGIRVYSDNLLPVPAVDPRGIPSTQFMPITQRRQRQIQTLPNLIGWPNATG